MSVELQNYPAALLNNPIYEGKKKKKKLNNPTLLPVFSCLEQGVDVCECLDAEPMSGEQGFSVARGIQRRVLLAGR